MLTRSGANRKNMHQLQAANAAVARHHMPSVETQPALFSPSARVNSISSNASTAMSPTADASAPSLDHGSSPGAGSLFMGGGLGGQGPQLTCKCLNIAPFVLLFVTLACRWTSGPRLRRRWFAPNQVWWWWAGLAVPVYPCTPPPPLSHANRRQSTDHSCLQTRNIGAGGEAPGCEVTSNCRGQASCNQPSLPLGAICVLDM